MRGVMEQWKKVAARACIALAGLVLAGCVGARPDGAMCQVSSGAAMDVYNGALAQVAQNRNLTSPEARHKRVNILALSGGGAWGAYGAGFLNGWSVRNPQLDVSRPEFDVVTGVSTGAMIAPFALLGSNYDATIAQAFRGVASNDLFTQRSFLGLPFWSSLKNPEPMRLEIAKALDDDAIAGLSRATAAGRTLWVGAVNFDSGGFTQFDLTRLAQSLPPQDARNAIVQRIMAASAIPGYFPPRFIDGCMYMDGAVRENLFVSQIGGAVNSAVGGGRALKGAEVDIYVIVNGPTLPRRHLTDNTLVGVGVRGFELAADQIQLASLREVYDYAHANGYRFYWTSADDVIAKPGEGPSADRCAAPETTTDQFTAAFTTCLFDAGQRKAMTNPTPWSTSRP